MCAPSSEVLPKLKSIDRAKNSRKPLSIPKLSENKLKFKFECMELNENFNFSIENSKKVA